MSHRYLVLGLLRDRPMTGYDIKKHVKTALGAVMNASYGTLYPTLHKLLKEGAVAVKEVPQNGRPAKKVYRITDAGEQELEEWLQQPSAADQVRREFLLKLYLARDLSKQDLLAMLAARRSETEAVCELLCSEKDGNDDQNMRHTWVMDYILSLCEAEIDWIKRIEAEIGVP